MNIHLSEVSGILHSSPRSPEQLDCLYRQLQQLSDLRQYLYDLSDDKRLRLLSAVGLRETEEAEVLFEKGSQSDFLYVLLSGVVGIHDGHGANSSLVAMLSAGKVFGERGLVRKAPRMFTARAATKCSLLTLSAAEFKTLLEPAFRLRTDEKVNYITRYLPGGKKVLPTAKEKLAYALTMRFCPRGKRLLVQGKSTSTLFFIVSGECTVSQVTAGTQSMVVTLGPGSLFGDECVLLGQPSSYSVDVTSEGTRVYTLEKSDAMQFIPELVLDCMREQCHQKFQSRHSLLSRSEPLRQSRSNPHSPDPLFRLASPVAKRKLVFAQRVRPSLRVMDRSESDRLESLRVELFHFTPTGRDSDYDARSWRSPPRVTGLRAQGDSNL